MSGNLLFNVKNHSFLSGLQEFHSFGSEIFTRLHLESSLKVCSNFYIFKGYNSTSVNIYLILHRPLPAVQSQHRSEWS